MIVDLEDGVAAHAKEGARAALPDLLEDVGAKPVFVRVNAGDAEDLAAVEGLRLAGVVVPKVAHPEDVPACGHPVHCLIESAVGVEAAYEIASVRGVAGISLGEADLRSETGASEEGLDWPRARIVNAAVAAGLLRPPQSVFPNVRDVEGLARSCARGRALGHLGRTAIHPGQLEIIERAYLPTAADVTLARDTIDRLQAEGGASALEGGELVDDAMLGSARLALLLAERYGTAEAPA